MEEKTYVADIDRTVYDIKDDEKDAYKLQAGLTPEIVQKISCFGSSPCKFTMRAGCPSGARPLTDWIWTTS